MHMPQLNLHGLVLLFRINIFSPVCPEIAELFANNILKKEKSIQCCQKPQVNQYYYMLQIIKGI